MHAARPLKRLLLVAALAPLSLASGTTWAEDLPPQVRQALQLAAELPLPTKALGFHFLGTGKRADGAEVELGIRAEPTQHDGLPAWKLTEIWGAKTTGAGARRTVECVLAQDLTPIRGGTYDDGTAAPQKVEWLGGEKVLAVQVSGKGAGGKATRSMRSAWYAGQPVVEVGGFVLWARLLPRGTPPCQIDFGAPSWNRLTGEPHAFLGLGVVGGSGPDFMIQEPNAPEPTRVSTWAWLGNRQDGSKLVHVLVDTTTGWPRMVSIHGTTYAGESRGL
jgi:hypothetical protein